MNIWHPRSSALRQGPREAAPDRAWTAARPNV
jgi:hypothetical protein